MNKVLLGISISLDGYIAGTNNDAEQPLGENGMAIHRWFFDAKTPGDQAVMEERMTTTGAVILGAKTYRDAIDHAWGGETPFHAPAFVLMHKAPEKRFEGFTYVTDGIESALQQARAAAGEKAVWLMGGASVLQQYLAAGLVDEIYLHIAPVMLGSGVRLFEHMDSRYSELALTKVMQTPAALHVHYDVVKRNQPTVLYSGLSFGESPRWHEGKLWVADWGTGEILTIDPDGTHDVAVKLDLASFGPVCMDWLPDGRMLIVAPSRGDVLIHKPDGSLRRYADLSAISTIGWNEIVVDGRGNAYVNNIGFDFGSGAPFAPGIIALVTPDGSVRQVADGLAFPNGMAVTPDNSTLIVAESYGHTLTSFDINRDGTLSNRRAWAELGEGTPDGICLDDSGAVWYADVPNRCCVRVREGGVILETIPLDRGAFACALGGADGNILFIVSQAWGDETGSSSEAQAGQVLAVQVEATGVG